MDKNTHAARAPQGPSRPKNTETFERSKLDSLIERIAALLSEQERNQWLIGDLLSEAFGQELDGKRVTNQRLSVGTVHQMEKPAELCRFFLERLTVEGDLVLDLFGCSGSMACECILRGRRWRYSESNKLNYELGLSRISAAVEQSAMTSQV